MKHKLKFIFLFLLGLGISLPACKDYLDVNVDPNQSINSRVDLQLSTAQLETAIGIGQRIYPAVNIWSQYYTGGPGVALGDPDQHKMAASELNEVFRSMSRSSVNLNFITKTTDQSYYGAIAKIMKAYNFQVLADLFGDVPYTEALKGDIPDGSILHPHYDSAKDVLYPGIEAELLAAIRIIEAEGAHVQPGVDDLVYHGDMEQWNKFAHTLLLKIYLRQGESGRSKTATLYRSNDQFITRNEDNGLIAFPGGSSGSNPFWDAAKSSIGNYYVATTTVLDYLTATQDPRIDAFFDRTSAGTHIGLYPGDISNAPPSAIFSRPAGALAPAGGLIFSPTAPVIFISAWEGNLLLAEAAARGWISTDAQAAYEAGVAASFEYLGVDLDSAYLAGPGGFDASNPIRSIALQKWTSMNGLQPLESWIETRRFETPEMRIFYGPGGLFKSPTLNALGAGIFPSIMPYPEDEESLNQNFPGQHRLTDKVFWDN